MSESAVELPADPVQWIGPTSAPSLAGWYATLHSWDDCEGYFPGAHYWDGARWRDGPDDTSEIAPPVTNFSPRTFATPEEARAWADDNDPDRAKTAEP